MPPGFAPVGPIGIASSCLTASIQPLQTLLESLASDPTKSLLGWITLKTIDEGCSPSGTRIIHFGDQGSTSSPLPYSLICRGRNECFTVSNAATLSKELRSLLDELGFNTTRIKISLPILPIHIGYINILSALNQQAAVFDAVEVPLKYLIKPLLKEIDPLDLDELNAVTREQYGTALATLAFLRLGLNKTNRKDIPISMKLSVDNLMPQILAVMLLAPDSQRMKRLVAQLNTEFLDSWIDEGVSQSEDWSGLNKSSIHDAMKVGADAIVLFDSEKMPFFLPDPENLGSAHIPAAEGGYSAEGGTLAGKAIAKDSLKYTFLIARSLVECKQDYAGRIISSGGCDSGLDVATRLTLGASGIEICTAILREGPVGLTRVLNEFNSIADCQRQPWQRLCGLAPSRQVTKDQNLPFSFRYELSKCTRHDCSAICWRTGSVRKGSQEWPPNGCIRCASCVSLCREGGLTADV